jgi:phosphoadenosine phosphosulfate reductase
MIATQSLDVRIVEVDTGLLFPETHAVRERLVQRYGIEVETLRPRRTVDQQASDQGPQLWLREPDRCCAMRKVEPLERALGDADAWVSGLRRSSGGSRSGIQPLSLDEARGVVKVAPLWDWTSEDVEDFVARNRIPVNALHAQSYPSIGCMPCTRPVGNAADERAGRWAFSGKTECGLHYPTSAS